jgi:hypothetical protein
VSGRLFSLAHSGEDIPMPSMMMRLAKKNAMGGGMLMPPRNANTTGIGRLKKRNGR